MSFIRFDSVGGASGDMLLSALTAIGADLEAIEQTLHRLLPEAVHLHREAAADRGLLGVRVNVRLAHAHDHAHWPDGHDEAHAPHRGLPEIRALLDSPLLDAKPRRLALAVFRRLAEAEGRVHGRAPETVRFHEVGAADSIADIVGCCLALDQLDVAGVSVGPLPCGVGTIQCAHGAMPNPAPATVELLAGLAVTQTDEPFELVTPTAAALLATWLHELPPPPGSLCIVRSGLGFGRRNLRARPNVLRATLLEAAPSASAGETDLQVLETNVDDCNPQWLGDLIGRLLEAGALDAWIAPATMKKNRPGFVVSALVPAAAASAVTEALFRCTTTFGVRSHAVQRQILDRRFETVTTPFGAVRVKVGSRQGADVTRSPEFEDCARLAREAGVTPRQVYEAALRQDSQPCKSC